MIILKLNNKKMVLIIGIIIIYMLYIIKCFNINSTNTYNKKNYFKDTLVTSSKSSNLSSSRNLLTNTEIQKINKIINIYSPYNVISYISSKNNEHGDLFISTNSEEYRAPQRIVYALKSDGSNYFSDGKSFKIYNISDTHDVGINKYPMIIPLVMKGKESIISLAHESCFEAFDLEDNNIFIKAKNTLMTENSIIAKNSFFYLKYYNYSNYLINAYINKSKGRFYLIKLYFDRVNLTKIQPKSCNNTLVEGMDNNSSVTCFELEALIECFTSNSNGYYTIIIFEILHLKEVYSTTIETNQKKSNELFSKCIYFKDKIGAFIYFLNNDNSPKLIFKKLIIQNSSTNNYILDDYLGPITINSNKQMTLGSNYTYNDIIKLDNNNIFYVSTNSDSEIIMIIMIKLLNEDKNVLINHYKIDLIKIYKDITIFTLKGFIGIGMTHYNYTLNTYNTYSSYFIIGIGSSNDIIISDSKDIFDENDNLINMSDLEIFIENNIFGYSLNGIRIISPLNELELGFYLYSSNEEKKIKSNDTLSLDDQFTFKIVEGLCTQKGAYSLTFETILTETTYSNLISLPDLVEYYPTDNNDLEQYYEPKILYGRKNSLNFTVKCYKTCQACSCYGSNDNHYCLTCSTDYPYIFINESTTVDLLMNVKNCLEKCPYSYAPDENNTCIKQNVTSTIPQTVITTTSNNGLAIISTSVFKDISSSLIIDFPTNNEITSESPNNDIAKSENFIDPNDCIYNIRSKIINQICFPNFLDISDKIQQISENRTIIYSVSNSSIYGYLIGNESIQYFYDNNLIHINFTNCINEIRKKLNLESDTDLYALIVDIPSKYANSSTKDFSFFLLLKNGTELDIHQLDISKINISIPMINLDLLNYDYATYFKPQGYDIYDKNSIFYYDICSPAYYEKNDITLKDRNEEIYPKNVSMNKNNCTYKLADLEMKRFIYECDFTEDYNTIITNEEDKIDVIVTNFVIYYFDLINYKILICTHLIFDVKNYKKNLGLIICIIDFFLTIPFIFFHYYFDFQKIRIDMHKKLYSIFRQKYEAIQKLKNKIKTNKKENINKTTIVKNVNKNKKNNKKDNKNEKGNKKDHNKDNKKENNKEKKKEDKKEKNNKKERKNEKSNKKEKNKKENKKNHLKSNPNKKTYYDKRKNINIENENAYTKDSRSYSNINILAKKSNIQLVFPNNVSILNNSKNSKKIKDNRFKNNINGKKKFETQKGSKKVNIDIGDYNDLPYTAALRKDKRSIIKVFFSKIVEKIEIIDIFNKRYRSLLISKHFFYLLIDFLINAVLYSDDIVSHKSHNDGKLEYIVVLSLSLSSIAITFLIKYFLDQLIDFEEKFKLVEEIGKESALLRVLKKFFKEMTIKIFLFMFFEICILLFCFYYLVIFCTVYRKSQISLLINYFVSILEDLLLNCLITLIITITRKFGLYFNNKYIYNTSKYIDIHF